MPLRTWQANKSSSKVFYLKASTKLNGFLLNPLFCLHHFALYFGTKGWVILLMTLLWSSAFLLQQLICHIVHHVPLKKATNYLLLYLVLEVVILLNLFIVMYGVLPPINSYQGHTYYILFIDNYYHFLGCILWNIYLKLISSSTI